MSRALAFVVALSFVVVGSAAAEEKAEGASCPLHAAQKQETPKLDASVLGDVDKLLADTCGCKGAGDCTCKKGQCKCKNCGKKKLRMFESVKGAAEVQLPDARNDATAGVFI